MRLAGRSRADLPAQPPGAARAPRYGRALCRTRRPGGGRALRPAVRRDLLRHALDSARGGDGEGARRRADFPPGYQVVFIGEAEQLERTREAMLFTFALALVLLFMVLASQFNSFLQPFYVMLAVPLAIIGGVFALWLFLPLSQLGASLGLKIPVHTLNIYSMIGLTLLIGLVAKNSILLVDLANQRRAQGMTVDAALAPTPVRSACGRCS
ncbi:MAG: efflux RND transporter permease subunit [Burkholderiales bacterium]|nr:efflux RND transporter permease subunit [Burkholderiales bacterium]